MAKLTIADLKKIKENVHAEMALRDGERRVKITVHMGTCGIASGAREVVNALAEEVEESMRTDIRLTTSGCIGACEHEPVMTVESLGSQPVLYGHLDAAKAREVFRQTLAGKSAAAYVVYVGSEPSDIGRGKGGKA